MYIPVPERYCHASREASSDGTDVWLDVSFVRLAGPSAELLDEAVIGSRHFEPNRAPRAEAVAANAGEVITSRIQVVVDGPEPDHRADI